MQSNYSQTISAVNPGLRDLIDYIISWGVKWKVELAWGRIYKDLRVGGGRLAERLCP